MPNENGSLYDALRKPTYIRLLKLQVECQSLSGTLIDQNTRQEIRGSLTSFDLAKVPKYWALSYTWGDPERADDIDRRRLNLADSDPLPSNRVIRIGSVECTVSENLHNALIQLLNHCAFHLQHDSAKGNLRRLRGESLKGYVLLWIDSVCINQADLAEKSSQVNLMGQIYKKAARVIVWLGKDSRGDHKEVEKSICHLAELADKPMLDERVNPFTDDDTDLARIGVSGWNNATWITLAFFFGRSWFRRIWCVQEVLLQKEAEEVVVLYGDILLNWEQVLMASLWLTTSGLVQRVMRSKAAISRDDKTNSIIAAVGQHPSQIAFLASLLLGQKLDLPHIEHWAGTSLTKLNASSLLSIILLATWSFQATDPRDKIFGILGVMEQIARVWKFRPSRLIADYTKPTWKVFLEAAQDIYEGTGKLTILALASEALQITTPGLPSRVPDFSARTARSVLASRSNRLTGYDAARGSTSKFHINAKFMTLRAFTVGTVAELGESCVDMFESGRLEASLRLVLNCPSVYRTGENRIEAFWRTLIGDKEGLISEYYPARMGLGVAFGNWLKSMVAYRNLIESCTPEIRIQPTEYDQLLEMIEELACTDTTSVMPNAPAVYDLIQKCGAHNKTARSIFHQLGRYCNFDVWAAAVIEIAACRRMFRTSEGCLGLGPESVHIGDTVWVISGVMTPFVFRTAPVESNELYKIVGEAYVHGIMNGEEVNDDRWRDVCLI